MAPSQYLIVLLLTGLIGSILLLIVFFKVLGLFVKCPECGTKTRRSKHCQQCGKLLDLRREVTDQ